MSLDQILYKILIQGNSYQTILKGLNATVEISLYSLLYGTLLGAFICMLKMSGSKILKFISTVYIIILRGSPVLMLLMLLYYGVFARSSLEANTIAIIAFSLNISAHVAELLRASINATDRGQVEAARTLGFSKFQAFRLVTLPQVIKITKPVYQSTIINLIQRLYDIKYQNDEIQISSEEKFNDEEKEKLLELKMNDKNKLKESNDGIFYDDINVKNYDIKNLHNQIGFVQQEPSLFNTTIRENIMYGLDIEDTTDFENRFGKEIKKVLEIAQANFVFDKKKLPLGLDSNVGERGSKLSGGQKQRISIARALIKNPKILILDEATSALDSDSEFKFKKEIEKLKGHLTIIIISHRLSTIKDCDQIVVINNGEIVEKGNHDELYKSKGIYYNLMEKQLVE